VTAAQLKALAAFEDSVQKRLRSPMANGDDGRKKKRAYVTVMCSAGQKYDTEKYILNIFKYV
jgi:hypothetical protein